MLGHAWTWLDSQLLDPNFCPWKISFVLLESMDNLHTAQIFTVAGPVFFRQQACRVKNCQELEYFKYTS